MMKRITIKDIAAELRLSVSTVSRALTGDKNIREATRTRVMEVAKQMGYSPNPAATTIRTGRTGTVGVVIPEMRTDYTVKVIRGIQEVLYQAGIKVVVMDSFEDPEMEMENFRMMERFMVDGLIICQCSCRHNLDWLSKMLAQDFPMVFYGRIPYGLKVSQVLVDDYAKSFFMVEKMILAGRRHICHFYGPDDVHNSVERARGYRDALTKYNIPCEDALQIRSGMLIEDGRRAVDKLLASGAKFDAIFAFNEEMAVGAMQRLRERGIRVPEDAAISAFSGTSLAEVVYPTLSTVDSPTLEMGRVAARQLLDQLNALAAGEPLPEPRTIVLNAEINVRDSI